MFTPDQKKRLSPEERKRRIANAARKYPTYSAEDLNKISTDPNNPKRLEAEKQNKTNLAKRKNGGPIKEKGIGKKAGKVVKKATPGSVAKKRREQPRGY
jgi:hypothetical protein